MDSADHWYTKICLNRGSMQELQFWLENIRALNGYAITQCHAVTEIAYSNAPINIRTVAKSSRHWATQ